jgi:light-regulated signal transduction histidine kinase (bacteriophytochrome)
LERMQNAAARMQTLIADLLTFSRVISRVESFVPVDLEQIVHGVLGDLEVRIEKVGATVEVGALPVLAGDPTQMRQLMQNLIGNALKFQRPGVKPQVQIAARLVPETEAAGGEPHHEITVQDNGIGFDEKYLEKIFAVFQRLHNRQEYEGTGIGLAVCRRIVDRHGGSITARSQPGAGATFIIQLPARTAKKSK